MSRYHLAILVILSTGTASAEVFSPRVIGPHDPDPYNLQTIVRHRDWANLDDRQFAETLFQWLRSQQISSRRVHLSTPGPSEGTDKVAEFGTVADPMKTLAVYGYGDGRAMAGTFAALWEASGRSKVRLTPVTGSQDSPEQFRVDFPQHPAWPSVRFTEPRLGENGLAASRARYHAIPTGHTLGFVLRRGERFTRWWQPQGERWQYTEAEGKNAKLRKAWDEPPRGPKPHEKDAAGPLIAHGEFVYEPHLKQDATDFHDGVYHAENVVVTPDGLQLAKKGEGFAIFAVHSPYVIVADVGKLEDPKDDKHASVVELDAAEVAVSYSRDYGTTWLTLETKTFPARLDLSQQVAGSYGYLLRLDFKGEPGKSLVKSLKITTWVQVARGLLPAVQAGKNTFTLKTGDAEGQPTFPVVIDASTADENGFLRPVIRPPKEYVPGHANRRVIGPFTTRVAAAPHSKIVWLTVGGSFAYDPTLPHEEQPATLAYATDRPAGFQPVALPELPREHTHPHYHLDVPLRLETPSAAVYFQCEGKPALNQFRVTAHCVRDEPRPATPLRITHRWTEAGERKEHTAELTDRGEYKFDAGTEVVNESVEFAVPSARRE